jgi:hypothetical protein
MDYRHKPSRGGQDWTRKGGRNWKRFDIPDPVLGGSKAGVFAHAAALPCALAMVRRASISSSPAARAAGSSSTSILGVAQTANVSRLTGFPTGHLTALCVPGGCFVSSGMTASRSARRNASRDEQRFLAQRLTRRWTFVPSLNRSGIISHETSVVASPADRHATSDAATPSDTFEVSFVGPEPEREAEDAVEPTPAPAPAALPTPPASRPRLQFGKYRCRPDGRYGFMR